MAVIALLTDFGLKDEYAGVLKGVILSVNPQARIVDLSHGIDPQDVRQAVWLLKSAYAYFPRGTIHVAVVDPGVGSGRSVLAARYDGHVFLAPDNGLLKGLWGDERPDELVQVTNSQLWRHPVSRTFHGRDIFAPVAAHLSMGLPLKQLGPVLAVEQMVALAAMDPDPSLDTPVQGQVIAVDRFGNLVSDIAASQLTGYDPAGLSIRIGGHRIRGLSSHYNQGRSGEVLALIGSRQLLEIAVNGGHAAHRLKVAKGASVGVDFGVQD